MVDAYLRNWLYHFLRTARNRASVRYHIACLSLRALLTERRGLDHCITPGQQPPMPFIVGQGRSGTTLLRLMLDAHPDLAIPPETCFIPKAVRSCLWTKNPKKAFFNTLTSHPRWEYQSIEDLLYERIMALRPFTVSEGLRCFYRLYAEQHNKPRWGDKTPFYWARMSLISRAFPEARFIYLIRDGRAVSLSRRKAQFPSSAIEETARLWTWSIKEARQQSNGLKHYMEVRYEDLVLETEATLRKICAFIDLPWDPAMLNYHLTAKQRMAEKNKQPSTMTSIHALTSLQPQPNRVGSWKTEMSNADRVCFERIAGKTLRELGYELS